MHPGMHCGMRPGMRPNPNTNPNSNPNRNPNPHPHPKPKSHHNLVYKAPAGCIRQLEAVLWSSLDNIRKSARCIECIQADDTCKTNKSGYAFGTYMVGDAENQNQPASRFLRSTGANTALSLTLALSCTHPCRIPKITLGVIRVRHAPAIWERAHYD